MSSTVFYEQANAVSVLSNSFELSGTPTDPTTVSCVVTDPLGVQTTYNYNPGAIIKNSVGTYSLNVPCVSSQPGYEGLWSFVWIGTGAVQAVQPGTWRVLPLTGPTGFASNYCGMEELKSRLDIDPSDTSSDYEIQVAIQVVTNWINDYCGRHFNWITETRTYAPTTVWTVDIDDLVSLPSVVANTVVMLDYEGNGVYNVPWTLGVEYQLKLGGLANTGDNYNVNAGGVARPYRNLQVLTGVNGDASVPGGGWLPWLWPYTYLNRVQITGTWGWNSVPPAVSQAALILAVDMFKSKDAPWGVAGTAETGMIRVQASPWITELLRPYINMKRKAGV